MNDTTPEIAVMVRVRLMALSGAERFRMGAQMFEAARRMVQASLPADLTEAERKTHRATMGSYPTAGHISSPAMRRWPIDGQFGTTRLAHPSYGRIGHLFSG